jgi:hypothetical protein
VVQLCNTLGPLALTFVAMYFTMKVNYLLTLGLAVVAAGFLIRTFIIMHDCGHGFCRAANDIVSLRLALTRIPVAPRSHSAATSGDLRSNGDGARSRSGVLALRWGRFIPVTGTRPSCWRSADLVVRHTGARRTPRASAPSAHAATPPSSVSS